MLFAHGKPKAQGSGSGDPWCKDILNKCVYTVFFIHLLEINSIKKHQDPTKINLTTVQSKFSGVHTYTEHSKLACVFLAKNCQLQNKCSFPLGFCQKFSLDW